MRTHLGPPFSARIPSGWVASSHILRLRYAEVVVGCLQPLVVEECNLHSRIGRETSAKQLTNAIPNERCLEFRCLFNDIFAQFDSSGLLHYRHLAGRLRTKWVGVHTHEVYFPDTAHGFLAWAFATVLSVAVLASAAANS